MSEAFRVGPEADPDRYVLGPPVAAGAEGILYRGTITVDSGAVLDVAVKMLHPDHRARMAEWHRRWNEQVELLRSLQAPGVVAVRDGFIGPLPHAPGTAGAGGPTTLYLVMNWVEGKPLDAWAATHDEASPAELLKMLLPVAGALDLMHSGQATGGTAVIHGDVKPANILVQPGGDAVLVDFGLVRSLPGGRRLTGVAGTPGYMAPEVARDGFYTPAADRYALGGVAYFLLTGDELPVDYDADALRQRLASAHPGRTELVDHVMVMLALDPAARPHVLANWCAQLRNSSLNSSPQPVGLAPIAPARRPGDGNAPPSPDVSPRRPIWRLRRRRIVLLVGIAALLVAAVGPRLGRSNSISGVAAGPTGSTIVPTSITTAATTEAPATTVAASASARTDAAVLGRLLCRNTYLGYEVEVPAPFRDQAESALVGRCESFGPEPLPPPPPSGGILTAPIVFTALAPPASSVIAQLSGELASRATTVAGHNATVLEHKVDTVEPFPSPTKVSTYVIDLGRRVLVAQLATPAVDARRFSEGKQALDAMVGSLKLAEQCRNRTGDVRCGPFFWDPDPAPNRPLSVQASFSPAQPRVGDTVTFTVTAEDPDADAVEHSSATYGDEKPGDLPPDVKGAVVEPSAQPMVLRLVRTRSPSPGVPTGRWIPPPTEAGRRSVTLFHVYREVGDFEAKFSFNSANSAAPYGRDPYMSAGSTSVRLQVR